MAELRRDDNLTADDTDLRTETGSPRIIEGDTARTRNVIMDERTQPLAGAEPVAGTTPTITDRRVIDSQVLYQGPASDAPYGAGDRTMTDERRENDAVIPASRNTNGDTLTVDAARNAEARLNRSSDRGQLDETPQADLFPSAELDRFRSRWDQVQVSFVDDPEQAVKQADELVSSVVKRISDQFAEQRSRLEQQWHTKNEAATTEELRRSLRQYRVFFDRLLSL